MLEVVAGHRSARVFRWQTEAAQIPRCVGFFTGLSASSTPDRPLAEVRIASTSFDHLTDQNHPEDPPILSKQRTPYSVVCLLCDIKIIMK